MKKIIVCFLSVFFLISLNAYEVKFLSGEENTKEFYSAKPINIIFSANDTIIWETDIDEWIKKENSERRKKLSKEEMLDDMYKEAGRETKKGRKWGLTLIKDISEAKEGYLLIVNLDQCIPIPMIGFQSRFTVVGKKIGNNKELFKAELRQIKPGSALPRNALKDSGENFGEAIRRFLNDCKKGNFDYLD